MKLAKPMPASYWASRNETVKAVRKELHGMALRSVGAITASDQVKASKYVLDHQEEVDGYRTQGGMKIGDIATLCCELGCAAARTDPTYRPEAH